MTSSALATSLGLTAMAVRQHLYALSAEKLVVEQERPSPVGRPAKYWQLTREADRLFNDSYAELTVSLIGAVGDAFGEDGMNRVLEARCAQQRAAYTARITPDAPLPDKLRQLAALRTEEGYMAELKVAEDGTMMLVENHCPICAAATRCQGFCSAELELFRTVLGPGVAIERQEHIVSGARRCAYSVQQTAVN